MLLAGVGQEKAQKVGIRELTKRATRPLLADATVGQLGMNI